MRTLLAAVVCVVAVLSGTAAGAAPSGDHEHGQHSDPVSRDLRDYEAIWDAATPQQRSGASELIVDTAEATEEWQDVDAALADGFAPNRGGYGPVHYRNVGNRRDDATLDPEHPEALVYLQRPDGAPVLLGAVYVTMPHQDRKVPGGDITAWHVHHDLACHHPDVDPGCDDIRGGMLHVWLYDGVVDPFADPMAASMGGRAEWGEKLRDLAAATP